VGPEDRAVVCLCRLVGDDVSWLLVIDGRGRRGLGCGWFGWWDGGMVGWAVRRLGFWREGVVEEGNKGWTRLSREGNQR